MNPDPTRGLHGLVSLMHDAGDDGSHEHQPDPQHTGQPDGTVATAGGEVVDTWALPALPCTHPRCRCRVRWLPLGDGYAWRAVETRKAA